MAGDQELDKAIDVISAHTLPPAPGMKELGKPYWNTEQHVYKKGFDCEISLIEAFNDNYINNGATKITVWYGIAGVYPIEPYSEEPAMLLARSPWSGNYQVREVLWGYAHYGQFTEVGWQYLNDGCGVLKEGGNYVTLKSPADDYSVIIQTKGAKAAQPIRFQVGNGLSQRKLCVWRSNAKEQFVEQSPIDPVDGQFELTLDPDSIYSLSTTTGQQKGSFDTIPSDKPFAFPYCETFEEYKSPKDYGYLPRYFADIADAFELVDRPDGAGKCIRQVVPVPTISWAPDWKPYTIIGDDKWRDYEASADVYLNPGDSAGVMGRINNVGTGYGFIPKGYFVQLGADGQCRLSVIRGKPDPKKLVGDAEQQAMIRAQNPDIEGGEKVLGTARIDNIGPNEWHNVKLRFEGSTISAWVDGKSVLSANDPLYPAGMVGLMAGGEKTKLSTPYFDNLTIKALGAPAPQPTPADANFTPVYRGIPMIDEIKTDRSHALVLSAILAALLLTSSLAARAGGTVRPGEKWPDDRGQHINAHGGGIIKVEDTWYWFGEYRPKEREPGRRYVSCYSSKDLVHWNFRNIVFNSAKPQGVGVDGQDWVLERPKVFYNAKTKKYVMYMHIDQSQGNHYVLAMVGTAVCDTVDGNYEFVRAFRPLGKESRDIGQFIDDDGSAYLIFESRPTKGFFIAKLSDDYLDVAEETCFIQSPMEGGALVHYDGLYYLVASGLSGWTPNPNKYATAKSLKGPWSEFKDIAPPESRTYGSQSTMLLKVVGTKSTTVIFMGDIWHPNAQWDSRYLWMPLEIGEGKLHLPEPSEWTIDIHSEAAINSAPLTAPSPAAPINDGPKPTEPTVN
jgi:hypothetical protein